MLKARINSNLKVVGPLLAELLRNGLFYFQKPDSAIVASKKVGMRWVFHYCDLLLILSMELPKPGKAPCNPSWGPTGITWGLPRFGQIHRQYVGNFHKTRVHVVKFHFLGRRILRNKIYDVTYH